MRHGIKASLAAAVAALFALGVPAGAQSLGQPVYESIDRWEALGYIDRLYVLRPYSPEELSRILEAVIAAGTPADAAEAQAFMADLGSGGLSLAARHVSGASAGTGGARYAGISSAGLSVAANPADSLWLSGGVDLALQDGRQAVLPYGRRGDFELNDDPSMNFLPAGLSGDAMGLLYALSSNVWFGSASLWGSASYARSSAGPFWNNGIFIGPQASAAPNWTLHASFGPWRYSSALFQLVPKGPGSYAHEKYLAFHSYSFSPAAGLDLGVLETVVWAGTFKPLYLVPLSMLFYMQSLAGTGYGDNSLAGVYEIGRAHV